MSEYSIRLGSCLVFLCLFLVDVFIFKYVCVSVCVSVCLSVTLYVCLCYTPVCVCVCVCVYYACDLNAIAVHCGIALVLSTILPPFMKQ